MCEKSIIRFGPEDHLLGVLTGPQATAAGRIVLVLPSAGLQPRSGPFRLHVELGERLAVHGIHCFRFDVPGVGEAPRIKDFGSTEATRAALDRLEHRLPGADFVVGGICSAADAGWRVAVADARVKGMLMLDGLSFTGPWFHFARNLDRLRRLPHDWRRMLGGLPARMREQRELTSNDFRDWPDPDDARLQFAQLVQRGVRQLWVYSGSYTDRFLHPRQFRWSFGAPTRDRRVAMHYWPDCDHTYYDRGHRSRLIDTIEDWMLGLVAQRSAA